MLFSVKLLYLPVCMWHVLLLISYVGGIGVILSVVVSVLNEFDSVCMSLSMVSFEWLYDISVSPPPPPDGYFCS